LIVAIALQLSAERDELAALGRVSAQVLVATLGLQLGAQLLWNGAMLLPLRSYAPQLGYWELFVVRTGGFVAGYVVPVANLGVRMAYLKRRGLGYGEFAWATALSNVLALFSGGVVAMAGLAALRLATGMVPAAIVGLTVLVLAIGVAGVVALRYVPIAAASPRLIRWPWITQLGALKIEPGIEARALVPLLFRHACNFITFGLLLQSLAPSRGAFLAGGLIYAVTSPVRILTITPGNLGINEWVVAGVGRALSVDLTIGLLVALVFRVVSIAAQALGVLIGGAWLAARTRR
jgi:hypothetical protein